MSKIDNSGLFAPGISHPNYKHGHTSGSGHKSPTYATWICMMGRCNRPNIPSYRWYGALGIKVCERWHSFENFLADMGERPPGMTIERKDNRGNYEKENCKWATAKEQSRHLRNNVYLTIDGVQKLLVEWCELYGRSCTMVRQRVKRGWTDADALGRPPLK